MIKTQPCCMIIIVVLAISNFGGLSFEINLDDESIVQVNCIAGQSVCADLSQCIPSNFLCDGRIDCEDGSDEKSTLCYYRNFSCANGEGSLIRASLRCDGSKNCPDGSDEENCRRRPKSRPTHIFLQKSNDAQTMTPWELAIEDSSITSSTFSVISLDEEKTTTELEVKPVSFNPVELNFEKNLSTHYSLYSPANDLRREDEATLFHLSDHLFGFLKLFSFWLTIAIGSLTGLAFIMTVLVYVSIRFRKRESRAVNFWVLKWSRKTLPQEKDKHAPSMTLRVPDSSFPDSLKSSSEQCCSFTDSTVVISSIAITYQDEKQSPFVNDALKLIPEIIQ